MTFIWLAISVAVCSVPAQVPIPKILSHEGTMEVVLPLDERQPTTHDLPNAFPSFPLLVRLLGFAHRFSPDRAAIKDLTNRSSVSHIKLLNDTLALRNEIYRSLDERVRDLLAIDGHVSFLLLAGPGYDYVVGFLAILSLGGIIVPVSPHVPLKEALYFAEKSAASAIVSRESLRGPVTAIQTSVHESRGFALPAIYASQQTTARRQLQPDEIHIETNRSLSADKPGLMIFTSGTTGKPKAVLLPREIMVSGVQALADHFDVRPSDVALHCMPVHHIAGIVVCFVPFLFGGACIEFDSFDPQRIWERWQHGGLTVFGGVVCSLPLALTVHR
jgi:malonyl-CoA/methylmalonyl-CoA synthetase